MALETPEVQENTSATTPAAKPDVPSSKGKNVAITAIVVLVILVVFVAIWFALKSTSTQTPTTTGSTESAEIKSDADLEKLEKEVRNTNADDLSTDLDDNDTDSAGF